MPMQRLRSKSLALATAAISVLAIGCSSSVSPDASVLVESSVQTDAAADALSPPSSNWCFRLRGGSPGARAIAVDLSAAHAGVRFFSPLANYRTVDRALASVLNTTDALAATGIANTLARYDEALDEVCVVASNTLTLGTATVEQRAEGLAWIRPGSGTPQLPTGTRAVAIDLRGLPAVPELPNALESALSVAMATPLPQSSRGVRQHRGLTDEVFSAQNVYSNTVFDRDVRPYRAAGTEDLPIVLVTEAQMAPATAEFAGSLRMQQRAWIVGESVLAAVAESRWQGVGPRGVVYRAQELLHNGVRWPDEIAADQSGPDLEAAVRLQLRRGSPTPIASETARRTRLEPTQPFRVVHTVDQEPGSVRAALLITHGATRLFFPYFAVVGDTIDTRLIETLGQLPSGGINRVVFRDLLRRFGEALHDGHNFVVSMMGETTGYLPVLFDRLDGQPVVRRSGIPEMEPGDTLLRIDTEAATDWFARELQRTSAATEGYRFDLASRYLQLMDGPTSYRLRGPDGTERDVRVEPQPASALDSLRATPSTRTAGFLTDMGAPELYYLNLSGEVLTTGAECVRAIGEASRGAMGLVLDMRGYPGAPAYTHCLPRLLTMTASSPIFRVPVLTGPDDRTIDETVDSYAAIRTPPTFDAPIVLLVGPITVSSAENLSTALVNSQRVRIVGRRSAGTNGNITGVQLPGGFGFTFTGMEVLYGDRRTFHGVGIVPDVESAPTPRDLRDGRDAELQTAIAELRRMR